jgi:hypothetical protein
MSLLSAESGGLFPRDDYRECAENALTILGETPPRGVHFLRPGAVHQARWMSCNIYAGKMFMFAREMGYDENVHSKLTRMNMFLQLFYVPLWLKAGRASDAPMLDLQFFKDMTLYRNIDREVADVVLRKIDNHRWYLTQEVVPFVLFSTLPEVTSAVKEQIAARIMITECPESFRLGKPVFPKVTDASMLSDFVGPESFAMFKALKVGSAWLAKPADDWPEDADYQISNKFVKSVKVVNDPAERGIKLISDFATHISTDPDQQAALLQGVEKHRRDFPSFTKKVLNEPPKL